MHTPLCWRMMDGCSSYHIPGLSSHFYLALTLGDVHWLNNRKTYVWWTMTHRLAAYLTIEKSRHENRCDD